LERGEGTILLINKLQLKIIYICLDREGNIDLTFIPTALTAVF